MHFISPCPAPCGFPIYPQIAISWVMVLMLPNAAPLNPLLKWKITLPMFPPYFVFTNNNLCEEEQYVFLKSFTIKSIFWFSGYYMHIPFGTISWRTNSIDRWIFFSSGWFNVTEINPNIFFVGFCLNISYSFYANSTPM